MGTNAFGKQLWRENDEDPKAFERIAGLRSTGGLTASAETFDDTEVDQDDNYKQFGKGQIDPGEFEAVLTWKKPGEASAAAQALYADLESSEKRRYQVRLPEKAGKAAFTYTAHVVEVGVELPTDGAITRKVKFKLSGKGEEGVWV